MLRVLPDRELVSAFSRNISNFPVLSLGLTFNTGDGLKGESTVFGARKRSTPRLIESEKVDQGVDPSSIENGKVSFDPKLMLFDDAEYSVALGVVDNALKCGIRINGVNDPKAEPKRKHIGFPHVQSGEMQPLWFLLPDWLMGPAMQAALEQKKLVKR